MHTDVGFQAVRAIKTTWFQIIHHALKTTTRSPLQHVSPFNTSSKCFVPKELSNKDNLGSDHMQWSLKSTTQNTRIWIVVTTYVSPFHTSSKHFILKELCNHIDFTHTTTQHFYLMDVLFLTCYWPHVSAFGHALDHQNLGLTIAVWTSPQYKMINPITSKSAGSHMGKKTPTVSVQEDHLPIAIVTTPCLLKTLLL